MKKAFASLVFQIATFTFISFFLLVVNVLYANVPFDARLIAESGPAILLQGLFLSGVFTSFHAIRLEAGSLRSLFVNVPVLAALFALSIYVTGKLEIPEAASLEQSGASMPFWNRFVAIDGVRGFLGKGAQGYFVPTEGAFSLRLEPVRIIERIEAIPPKGDLQGLPAFLGEWARDASITGGIPARELEERGLFAFGAYCLILGILARGLGAFVRASKWPMLNLLLALIAARFATWIVAVFSGGAVLDFFASLTPGSGPELWSFLVPGVIACGLLLWEAAAIASAKGRGE